MIEGMAAGAPVIASDVPAHREIGQNTIDYIDPASVDSIAAKIEEVLARSIDYGRERRKSRAQEYDWQASGTRLAALLQGIAST